MTSTKANRDPRLTEAIEHAFLLDRRGETDAAVQHLTAFVEQFSGEAILHFCLGLFLSRCGQFEQAIEQGNKAVRLSPEWEKASLVDFNALWKAERKLEALAEMNRFLAVKSSETYSDLLLEYGRRAKLWLASS